LNTDFSTSSGAASAAGAATATGAAALTPNLSSITLTKSASSKTVIFSTISITFCAFSLNFGRSFFSSAILIYVK